MKSKLIITIIIFTLLFYCFRIHIELKSRSVGLFMDYKTMLHYYYDDNNKFEKFMDKLIQYKIFNILIYPSTFLDLTCEYNEIMLMQGNKLNLLFKTKHFVDAYTYLLIPKSYKDKIITIPEFLNKFAYNKYIIFEFSKPFYYIQKAVMEYHHKYEDLLIKKKFNLIRLQDKGFVKEIDNFLIKGEQRYFISDKIKKNESVIKIHKFNKIIYEKKDINKFIDENVRAVVERNVKGIIIPVLIYKNKIIKLNQLILNLIKRLEKKSYSFARNNPDVNINKELILLYKIIITLLAGTLFICLFPSLKYYFLLLLTALITIKFSLIYIILIFLFFFIINNFILKCHTNNAFNLKNLFLFTGYLFLAGICISNFLWMKITFFYPYEVYGIKIVFILPLILWTVQYIYFKKYHIKQILKWDINMARYIILTLFFILIPVLLLRTGNYYLGVSSLELKVRQVLENIFFIRPRFKEMFFYTFLFLLFMGHGIPVIKNNFFLIYLFTLIAVSTTMNSFLHIHTLSYYSIIRSLIGMGIGGIVGGVVLFYNYFATKTQRHKVTIKNI